VLRSPMSIHISTHHWTLHSTTLAIVIAAVLCAERVLAAYPAWTLAKRKGRMWFPYELFGLVGLIVLALRSPAYSVLSAHVRPARRAGYTHTGFSGPLSDALPEIHAKRRKKASPLAEYHLPRGFAD
jgi:hypothetical protein